MSPETRSRKTGTRTGEQTCSETEPETGNPPIKRRDGTYRPLDKELVERLRKGIRDSHRRNPDSHRHQAEFRDEHGLERMSK